MILGLSRRVFDVELVGLRLMLRLRRGDKCRNPERDDRDHQHDDDQPTQALGSRGPRLYSGGAGGGWPVVLGEFRRDLTDDGHGSVAGWVNPGSGGIGKWIVDPPPGDRVEPLFRGRYYAFHGPGLTAGQPSRTLQLGTPRPSEWVHAAKPDRAQEPNDPMSADTASHEVRLGPEELSALTARRRAAQPRMQTTQ